jgi:GT2 family glycosyltransferase
VAIVTVNWNNWRDTLECLESVSRLDYHEYFTIVVDNASQDDSLAQLQDWARRRAGVLLLSYSEAVARAGGDVVHERSLAASGPAKGMVLIQSAANSGPTGGGNLAIKYALTREQPAEYIFLLDNDATVEKDTLTHLVDLDRKENAGIVGGVIISQRTGEIQLAERTTLLRWFFNPLVSANLPTPGKGVDYWLSAGVSGGAMLIRRDVLDTVYASTGRYLAVETFMDGWEFEFCYRSSLAGYRSLVTREGFVRHKGDRSARSRHSPKRYYYTTRNPLLFASDFLPIRWRLLFHPWYAMLCVGRIAKALKFGRYDVARAIGGGWRDGIRGERTIRHEYEDKCT